MILKLFGQASFNNRASQEVPAREGFLQQTLYGIHELGCDGINKLVTAIVVVTSITDFSTRAARRKIQTPVRKD